MPWLETAPMEQRLQFVDDARSDRFTMAELCARYGVSRRVGYKWIERFEEEGRRGLRNRSRAPHHCPHRIDAELAELLCAVRRAHPLWGARKLLRVLTKRHPRVTGWPAPRASTAPSSQVGEAGDAAHGEARPRYEWITSCRSNMPTNCSIFVARVSARFTVWIRNRMA